MTRCAIVRTFECCWGISAETWGELGSTTGGRLFKSGFEIPVHGDKTAVAESGAWCNDLEGRCHKGELR